MSTHVKDILVNEAFFDSIIDDPELELEIRNIIIHVVEMYTAHFLEHPECSENLYENTKDFTRKVLIRYFDLLCRLRDEQLDKNEILPVIDMMNPIQGEC